MSTNPNKTGKILVTRPKASAAALESELRALGFEVVSAPMMEIINIDNPPPISGDAVMFTSGSAATSISHRKGEIEKRFSLPCFCVGEATAQKASDLGFENVIVGDGDGENLARAVENSLPRRATLLHACGCGAPSVAAELLADMGYNVVSWPVYRAEAATEIAAKAQQSIKQGEIAAALFFSPRTAEIFAKLISDGGMGMYCRTVAAVAISGKVVSALAGLDFKQFIVAPKPNEASVIECLVKKFS